MLQKCFDYSSEAYERIVDTHIKNLRAKLGDAPWIETVRGYGYRFIGYASDMELSGSDDTRVENARAKGKEVR